MGESLVVAGFLLTREEWDALGEGGRSEILEILTPRPVARGASSASKVGPLPLPAPRPRAA